MRKTPLSLKILFMIVLFVILFIIVFPFYWTLVTSLKTTQAIHSWPPQWFPKPAVWDHYKELFQRMSFERYLLNSIIVTLCGTLLSVLLNALGGYTFAKFEFPLRNKIFLVPAAQHDGSCSGNTNPRISNIKNNGGFLIII